jgi:hypothetical protein
MDGNALSSTTGGVTITAPAGQNVEVGGNGVKLMANEANFTLAEITTLRTDSLQNDTSNGDISISTQGTGQINLNAAVALQSSSSDGSSVAISLDSPVAILAGNSSGDEMAYTLADGTTTGQIMYLVRGGGGSGANHRGSIHVVFNKLIQDGAVNSSVNLEMFTQFISVVTCIWRGDGWVISNATA